MSAVKILPMLNVGFACERKPLTLQPPNAELHAVLSDDFHIVTLQVYEH